MSNPTFEGLGLDTSIASTLVSRGYEAPTPIQAALIPVLLEGSDAIGQAPTGTGKTAAFSLPLIQRVTRGGSHVQVLVLAPTRELALQVSETMEAYGKDSGLRVVAVYGGESYRPQITALRRGVDVVVGTPGRLKDLIEKRVLDLSQVSSVVLDEADEMLSMGFVEDIEELLQLTPETRQTVLMSATMPGPIRKLAKRYLRDAVSCKVQADEEAPAVRQRAFLVNHRDKVNALTRILEVEDVGCALVFAKTRAGTEDLAAELVVRGVAAEALHGDMNQDARTRVVQRLRDGGIRVLVGTDVAARGLDIPGITHVFNYELPANPEVFVHRIGRTARAGRGGDAVLLYAPNETGKLRRIERFLKTRIELAELPTVEEIEAMRSSKLAERVQVWVTRGRCHGERTMVQEMVEAGGDPVEIAAAALRLARQAEFSRPVDKIGPVVERRPKRTGGYERGGLAGRGGGYERGGRHGGGNERGGRSGDSPRGGHRNGDGARPERSPGKSRFADRGDMVPMILNAGHSQQVQVNQIVSTIARHGGVPSEAIGRIQIQDRQTVVSIRKSEVKRLLGKSGELRVGPVRMEVVTG